MGRPGGHSHVHGAQPGEAEAIRNGMLPIVAADCVQDGVAFLVAAAAAETRRGKRRCLRMPPFIRSRLRETV